MSLPLNRTSKHLAALILAMTLVGGMTIAHANEKEGGHTGMHKGMQHHGKHMAGKHGGGHGKGMHGARNKEKHLFGAHWKTTLTDEQKAQLDKLHLQFARTKAPLQAGIKAMKVQLAVLAISDQAGLQAIDAKLNELFMAKRELMRAKYTYLAAQRQVLTPAQQVSFDMDVLHKAMHGKKDKSRHSGRKH